MRRQCVAVGPTLRQRLKHIGHGNDAGLQRDAAGAGVVRVTRAVDPFMVL